MGKFIFSTSLTFLLVMLAASIAAQAQTDVSISVLGSFNRSTSSTSGITAENNTITPANAAGGIIELRHIHNSFFGYEATYSFNRSNQSDNYTFYPPVCPVNNCGPYTLNANILADTHQLTGNWVFSLNHKKIRPFALAGYGVLIDLPAASTVTAIETTCQQNNPLCNQSTTSVSTQSQTKPVFVYGAGFDWKLMPKTSLRLQYRGNIYKTPALLGTYPSTSTLTHSAQPMLGIVLRF